MGLMEKSEMGMVVKFIDPESMDGHCIKRTLMPFSDNALALSQLSAVTDPRCPFLPFYSIARDWETRLIRARRYVSLAIIESLVKADLTLPRRVNSQSSNRLRYGFCCWQLIQKLRSYFETGILFPQHAGFPKFQNADRASAAFPRV